MTHTRRRNLALFLGLLTVAALPLAQGAASLAVLDNATAATSHKLTMQSGPYGSTPGIVTGILAPNNYNFDYAGGISEAFSVDLTGVSAGGSVTPTLLSDGMSWMDMRTASCGSTNNCVAIGSGSYVPNAKSAVYISGDAGVSWALRYFCTCAGTDATAVPYASWITTSVVAVWGKVCICYSNDAGVTWAMKDIYPPGISTYQAGDQGMIHVFRALDSSNRIRFKYTNKLSTSEASKSIYSNTLDPATGTLGSAATISSPGVSGATWWINFPDDNWSGFGFMVLGDANKLYVTTNGGTSWMQAYASAAQYPPMPSRVSCPQGASGTCYFFESTTSCVASSNVRVFKATSPFTSWTLVTFAVPTGDATYSAMAWYCPSDSFQGPACARYNSKDVCLLTLFKGGSPPVESYVAYTSNGFAAGSVTYTKVSTALGGASVFSFVTYPNTMDTGASTSATKFWVGGGRGTILEVSLDGTTATRVAPKVMPRDTPIAIVEMGNGTGSAGVVINSGGIIASASAGVAGAMSSGAWRNLWTTTGLSSFTSSAAVAAAGVLSPSSMLVALSPSPIVDAPNGIIQPYGSTNGVYYTADGGASWTKVCDVYTSTSSTYAMPPVAQIKIDYRRSTTSGASNNADVYIVHPWRVYKWDATTSGSSCGTLLHSITPPSVPMSTTQLVANDLAIGCSPDTARGCTILQMTQENGNLGGYDPDWNVASSVKLLADCGTGSWSSPTVKLTISWDTSSVYKYPVGRTSDVIYGSAAAGLAFTAWASNVFATTVDGGQTWVRCDLTSTACVSPALSVVSTVMSAAFVSPTVAYAYVGFEVDGYNFPAQAPKILRLTYTYSAGVGAVSVATITMSGGGNSLAGDGARLMAHLLSPNPRFFPAQESLGGSAGCNALPNSYAAATPAPSVAAVPSATPSTTSTSSVTATATATAAATATATGTGTASLTATSTGTGTSTATSTATSTSTSTSTSSATATATSTTSTGATATPTGTATATATSTGTATATSTMTATSSATETGTATATSTATSTRTSTATTTGTATATATSTATSTETATATSTSTGTGTVSETSTATGTATATSTMTATSSATNTGTATATSTATSTATATATATSTLTGTSTASATASSTGTFSTGASATSSPTGSTTPSPSPQVRVLRFFVSLYGGGPDVFVDDAAGAGRYLRGVIASAIGVNSSRVALSTAMTAYTASVGGALTRNVTQFLDLTFPANSVSAGNVTTLLAPVAQDAVCSTAASDTANGTARGDFALLTKVGILVDINGLPDINGTSAVAAAVAAVSAGLSTEAAAEAAFGQYARLVWAPCLALNASELITRLVQLGIGSPSVISAASLPDALDDVIRGGQMTTSPSIDDGGLPSGGIAGIVIAAIVASCCCFAFVALRRRRRDEKDQVQTGAPVLVSRLAAVDASSFQAGNPMASTFSVVVPPTAAGAELSAKHLKLRHTAVLVTADASSGEATTPQARFTSQPMATA